MKRKLIIILTAIMLLSFVQIGTIALPAQASTVANFFSASASSYYTQNRTSVAPSCAIDANEYSSWDSYGEYEGAWLELTSKNGVVAISGFRIENGKCKSRDYGDTYYYKNARIKAFSIYVDGARVYNGKLKDTNHWQEVDFGQAFAGTKFRLRVDSIYAGTGTPKSNFGVCITEIEPIVVKVKPAPTQTPLPTPTAVPTVKPVETPTVTATIAPAIVLGPESVILDTDIAVLSCPVLDTKVYDRDSAVLALEMLKEAIGFDNIGEFSEPKKRIAPVTASFSFEQYVDSIPVEGAEVRLITNRQGDVINVLNTYVDPNRVLRGNVGAPEAYNTVAAIEGTDAIVNLGKVICVTTGGDVHECYKLIAGNAGAMYYYVSTFSGEVVLCYSAALNDYAIGHGNSMRVNDGNDVKTFTTQYRNKLYYLEDYDRRIRVYDMNGFDVDAVFNDDRKDYEKHKEDLKAYYIVREHIDSQDYYVYDLDSPPYRSGVNLLKNNAVDSKHFYTLSTDGMTVYDNDRVLFTNPYREILWGKKSFLYSLNKEYELFKLASDKDNNWESESAVTAYLSLIDIMDFWNASLHRDGFDDTERSVVNVYVNAAVNNAFSFSDNCGRGVLFSNIVIGNPYDGKYDVLGHEFNHSVISSFCDLGKGYVYAEAAALNEGLSDIMGELCEDYTFGTCDWSNGRNLIDPKQAGYPEKYRGDGWITHDDEAYKILVMNEPESVKPRDKGHYDIYGHRNSTVIRE